MPKLKLHYDGWLALPVSIRRRLGVTTGDSIYAELVDGGLMLMADGATANTAASVSEDVPDEPQTAPKPAAARKKVAIKPRARSSSKLTTAAIMPARGRGKAKPKTA